MNKQKYIELFLVGNINEDKILQSITNKEHIDIYVDRHDNQTETQNKIIKIIREICNDVNVIYYSRKDFDYTVYPIKEKDKYTFEEKKKIEQFMSVHGIKPMGWGVDCYCRQITYAIKRLQDLQMYKSAYYLAKDIEKFDLLEVRYCPLEIPYWKTPTKKFKKECKDYCKFYLEPYY